MLAFFDLRFPVYEQNHVLIFPDEDRIVIEKYRSEEARILAYLTLNVKHIFFISCFKIKMKRSVKY